MSGEKKHKCLNCGTTLEPVFPDEHYQNLIDLSTTRVISETSREIKNYRMYSCPECGLLTWWREEKDE